jgi:hypothetical protein
VKKSSVKDRKTPRQGLKNTGKRNTKKGRKSTKRTIKITL